MQKDPTRRNTRLARRLRDAETRATVGDDTSRPRARLAHLVTLPGRYLRRAERRQAHVGCRLLLGEAT